MVSWSVIRDEKMGDAFWVKLRVSEAMDEYVFSREHEIWEFCSVIHSLKAYPGNVARD
jgi:hypothetical protein